MIKLDCVTAEELANDLSAWLDANSESGAGVFLCRRCGSSLHKAEIGFSVHILEMGRCSGFGTVLQVLIPYCPKCDGPPKASRACLHLAYVAARQIAVECGNIGGPPIDALLQLKPWLN